MKVKTDRSGQMGGVPMTGGGGGGGGGGETTVTGMFKSAVSKSCDENPSSQKHKMPTR